MYVDQGSGGTAVARRTFPTGDGDNWNEFRLVAINDSGNYVFNGSTDLPFNDSHFIAHNGSIAVRSNAVLDGVTIRFSRVLAINNANQVAHIWSDDSSQTHLFLGPADDLANSSLLLSQGDLLDTDGDGVDDAEISSFAMSYIEHANSFLADDGAVFVLVNADDLSSDYDFQALLRVEAAAPCLADLDDSGAVDFADVLVIIAAWGPCSGCPADLDGDGTVTFADLLLAIGSWGPC